MRILRTGVFALVVLGTVATVSADTRRPLAVVSAEVSATGTTLFVTGANFGRTPEVKLGGMSLAGVVVDASGTHLTANLPALPPGSYKLVVSRPYSWPYDDDVARLTVAIGATGPKGETGSMGEKGDPGPQGDPGAPGAQGMPGNLALAGLTCPQGVPLRGFSSTGGLVCGLTVQTACGNNALDSGEEFDPPPGPFGSVSVNAATCRFDFSQVTQLYCNSSCSRVGPSGCDQADANLLCQLKTGNPTSVASSFSIEQALDAPGFACPLPGLGTQVNVAARGVDVPVFYSDASLLETHGSGLAVTNVVCTP